MTYNVVLISAVEQSDSVTHIYTFFFDVYVGFPGGTAGKRPASQCKRHKRYRLDPWVGKIPWRREWQPSPVSGLENPMDRGAWCATLHRVTKSETGLK